MKIRCIHVNEVLKVSLEALGKQVARKPSLFLTFCCIVTIILGTGFLTSTYLPLTPEYFVIQNGKLEESKKMMQSLFPSNKSKEFNPARLSELADGALIYVIPKNRSGMLDKSVFQDIESLDKIVRSVSVETEKGLINYRNICATEHGACFANPIMKIIHKIEDIRSGNYRFKYPVNFDLRKMEVLPFALNLGEVTVDGEGYVEDFLAVRLAYLADTNDPGERIYIRRWEDAVSDRLRGEMFQNIDVFAAAFAKAGDDIREINSKLYPLVSVVVLAVIIFSTLAFVTNSWIRSKPWLGVAAGSSATLALTSAYGTMFYAGVNNTDLTLLVAFVVLGTEIDDAFIMVASWRCTNPEDSVEKRVAKTYSEAAVSVTVSSLTTFIAYCVGIATPIAIVSSVCFQCAVCILFTFFYQLLFFGPIMALDGYREKSQRNAFFFCKTIPDEGKCGKGDGDAGQVEETVMKYIRDVFGGFLQFPISRVICLMLFAGNIILASFFVMDLRKGSQVYDILRKGSILNHAMIIQSKYFQTYQYPINIVVNQTLNYWDESVQESISTMLKSFEDHPKIASSNVTVSWLKFYLLFVNHPMAKNFMDYDISKKETFLQILRRIFLRLKLARQFEDDINFNENYTAITSTRYIVFATNLDGVDDDVRLMRDVKEIVDKSKIPIKIFSPLFIQAEQASVIGKITMQTIWITTLLMFVIFLVFVANFPHAVLVAICVTSSMVGTVGFMSAWGIRLDITSLIVVVTCLGFSINYSAHMSYMFTTSKADTPNEKMKESIYRVGLPVIQGALSTIIAVIILMFQNIYVYVACFKVIFLTVMETSFHALFVLPVILYLFDSCLCHTSKGKKENEKNISSNYVVESHHL